MLEKSGEEKKHKTKIPRLQPQSDVETILLKNSKTGANA